MITKEDIDKSFYIRDWKLFYLKDTGRAKKDSRAGYDSEGYRRISISGKYYYEHRLIFFYVNGYLPDIVDHIDCDKQNNNPSNLREATKSQNGINRKCNQINNTSGHRNVYWHKQKNKWQVKLQIEGRQKSFGLYENIEDAVRAAKKARGIHFGEFI